MKHLFNFTTKKECSGIFAFAAKVFKIFYIALACTSTLFFLIVGISVAEHVGFEAFLVYLLLSGVSFFVVLFLGLFIETCVLSFSIITKNNYEQLIDKGKVEEEGEIRKSKNNSFDRLDRLNELKKMGILTDEEFSQKKKEIIEGL